ncbi:MAG: S-methyl-5-thioribose-1-phosphate isomerase [Planctomycetota bacterium]|nr:S-methyl-5-thioribose-1-phosphate isomerase [Planctomycetota bacterium]
MNKIPLDKGQTLSTVEWVGQGQGFLRLIDQTRLPTAMILVDCQTIEELWESIHVLRVRGAPAIGISAAYGVVLGMQQCPDSSPKQVMEYLDGVVTYIASSRPTAMNLFWALDRMKKVAKDHLSNCREVSRIEIGEQLLSEAKRIELEDRQVCRRIGRHGATLLNQTSGLLTHCNAGGLATADYGTALAVCFAAHEQGKQFHVFVDETRPLLQGARLTAWELMQRGIETTLICDGMAAQVMRENRVDMVITGADRIAANGDTANKIGTYSLAVLAHAHEIPFYVAAPQSTFDLSLAKGDAIPIEQRDGAEVTHFSGKRTAPEGVQVYNPAFDVTPARLISGIVTEHGIIQPVTRETIQQLGV